MKSLSKLILAVASLSAAMPVGAYAGTYYTRETVRSCKSDSDDVIGGALIGCGAGIGLNLLLGNRRGGDIAGGCIGGGVVGGLIGALGSMSCRDRAVYVEHTDRYLDEGRFDRPSRWQGGSVEVYKTFYKRDGSVCHVYKSITRDRTYKEVACKRGNMWQHSEYNDSDESVYIRESRSYGSWRNGTFVETTTTIRGGDSYYDRGSRDTVIIERRPVARGAVCVAENGRGIQFRARGYDREDARYSALRDCRTSYETYNPRSCEVIDCRTIY